MIMTPEQFLETQTFDDVYLDSQADPYKDSVFQDFKRLSSKKKGKFIEKLVKEYEESLGNKTEPKCNSYDHDLLVDRGDGLRKKEIKGSFLWGDGTNFRWQQIRVDQDYDEIIFVAIYPDRIEFYEATKAEVLAFVDIQDEDGNWPYNQHGGKTKRSGTFYIDGFPQDFPFMKPY